MDSPAIKRKNTMGRYVYLWSNIILTYVVGVMGFFIEYICGMSYRKSSLIQGIIALFVCCLLLLVTTVRYGRHNWKELIVNSAIMEFALFMGLRFQDTSVIKRILFFYFIVIMVISVFLFAYYMYTDGHKKTLYYLISLYFGRIVRWVIAVTIPVVLIIAGIYSDLFAFKGKIMGLNSEEVYEVRPVYGSEYSLANNIDDIYPIGSSDKWKELSLSERQKTIKAVINCELRYLGIPHIIDIAFEYIPEEKVSGYYSKEANKITIDNKALMEEGNESCLIIALHECRHVYQECMIEVYKQISEEERALLPFDDVPQWIEDNNKYIPGHEDEYGYVHQAIELDAQYYALENSKIYCKEINKLVADK